MPELPWKSFAVPERDKEYAAMLSYLPLNSWRALPKFVRYSREIRRQLAETEGLIGYSLDAELPGRKFWTLSVWEDEESLQRFVHRAPHGRVMTDLLPHMGRTEFFQFEVDAEHVPPDWEEARRRMRQRDADRAARQAERQSERRAGEKEA